MTQVSMARTRGFGHSYDSLPNAALLRNPRVLAKKVAKKVGQKRPASIHVGRVQSGICFRCETK
jgi:hypothetical protein